MHGERRLQVQLLSVPDCPLVQKVRSSLDNCLRQAKLQAVVEELVGEYSSPTLLVNGFDVTGRPTPSGAQISCRLDLPNDEEILAALCVVPVLDCEHEREKQLLRAAFRTLLDTTHSVRMSDLSAITGLDRDMATEYVGRLCQLGLLKLDPNGAIVGAAGLSVSHTKHELVFEGRRFWAWCALDILGIFGALGASGFTKSSGALGNEPIQVDFVDGVPQQTGIVIFIPDISLVTSICRDWCPNVILFPSKTEGDEWLRNRPLDGSLLSIQNVAKVAEKIWSSI
ncbi:hypothetical protein V1525DRAFT_225091 [Lipomyces kononenkoae]|uniref:Uncharacterized protein n=1 Tax=Lipomyces kononenkoae TaxID=34357 RepID=A0ACC3T8I0_LIPKO